jgi:hypothetical protein
MKHKHVLFLLWPRALNPLRPEYIAEKIVELLSNLGLLERVSKGHMNLPEKNLIALGKAF